MEKYQVYKLKDWVDKNKDKLNWRYLSLNPNAIELLKENPDKIDWVILSRNPNAIKLLEQNQDKINWDTLSENPNIFYITYNYSLIKERMNIIREELLSISLHPDRVMNWRKQGFMIDNLFYYSN